MNILHVIQYLNPKRGGEVAMCTSLAEQCLRRGHAITIATTDNGYDGPYFESLEEMGVTILPFRCRVNIKDFLISPQIGRWFDTAIRDFDVVHIHAFRSYQCVVAHQYAKKCGVPYVLQAHGSVLPFFQKHLLKKAYDFVWGRSVLRDASGLIAVNEMEVRQYLEMGANPEQITIIPIALDIEEYQTLPAHGMFRERFGIPENAKIILSLGRIHEIKGLDLLVEAFSDLAREVEDCLLILAGPDQGYQRLLQQQVKKADLVDRVLFTGPLYGVYKLEAYVDASVYVLPSIYEIFSLTTLEACLCETPVIVTDRCGLSPFLRRNGGCVVPYDRAALAAVLQREMNVTPERRDRTRRLKHEVEKHFSYNTVTDLFESLYARVCSTP